MRQTENKSQTSLSKFEKVHFFMYVFIYVYEGQLRDINERADRLFSPKMFKLNREGVQTPRPLLNVFANFSLVFCMSNVLK